MKKFISALAAVLLFLPFVYIPKANAINFPLKTPIQSESAVLINLDADTVIHEKNPDVKQMPGPLVNIMTAVVCLEKCPSLDEKLTLDPSVYSHIYDTLGARGFTDDLPDCDIKDGDVLTIKDLLYCMMLTSSVEAAETLAYHVGEKSVSAFVTMMNEKATEIGMSSTNFTNPTGMYDENQYTTARDMAVLTQYALDNVPGFENIATTYEYTPEVPNPENHFSHTNWIWKHTNIMMSQDSEEFYMGAKGIKTGNLVAAGRNIITLASKDGNNYLVVLLKAPFNDAEGNITFYHISDAKNLFNWAFSHFSYQTILADTAEVGEIPVTLADGNDYVLACPKEEFSLLWYDDIDISLIRKDNITWYESSVQAPVSKGDVLGEVTLEYSGEKLGTVELVAVSDVERSASKYNLYAAKKFKDSKWFKNAITISIVLCVIYIVICIYSLVVFKSKAKPLKPIYAVPKMNKSKKKKNSESDKQ